MNNKLKLIYLLVSFKSKLMIVYLNKRNRKLVILSKLFITLLSFIVIDYEL